jgi:hypothetical protein
MVDDIMNHNEDGEEAVQVFNEQGGQDFEKVKKLFSQRAQLSPKHKPY